MLKFFFPTKIFFRGGGGGFWGVWGAPRPHLGSRGVGNDTLLPMTMTCDRFKFWSGLSVKNYHPETLAAEE